MVEVGDVGQMGQSQLGVVGGAVFPVFMAGVVVGEQRLIERPQSACLLHAVELGVCTPQIRHIARPQECVSQQNVAVAELGHHLGLAEQRHHQAVGLHRVACIEEDRDEIDFIHISR